MTRRVIELTLATTVALYFALIEPFGWTLFWGVLVGVCVVCVFEVLRAERERHELTEDEPGQGGQGQRSGEHPG